MTHPSLIDRIFNGENVLLVTKTVTIASMGIAAGSCLSYNAMIMPALRKFSASSAVAVWAETAHGAMSIQISAVAISVLGGSYIYYKTKNRFFLYSSMLMASIMPYTFAFFIPINKALFAMRASGKDDGTIDSKMIRWNRLQYGRTLMNVTSLLLALYGGLSGDGSSA
ncbi:hypothetical protein BGZ59_001035 [Podila verticillata]|nr:hypothetical protein BGZ59_001035 [Podila verticillata]KAI9241158.1 MAG: hypothetical protein BYD32DRAFT_458126 [Podila humilis]KFH68843.1 hypothetical protein MVEG_05647 [Podila verticillata NRRL 6337]